MDLVQMLANMANNLTDVGIQLILALSLVGGILILIFYLGSVASQVKRGQVTDGIGKFSAVILLCCCIISLYSVMNASSQQMGMNDVHFGAIAYVSESRYGPAAVAINAGLRILQLIGVAFTLSGLVRLRRSLKDGHTGLSSGQDTSSGAVKIIVGVLLACNPQFLDALQKTLGIHW